MGEKLLACREEGRTGQRLVEQGREAFLGGIGAALFTGAAILVIGAVAVAIIAPRVRGDADDPGASDSEAPPAAT